MLTEWKPAEGMAARQEETRMDGPEKANPMPASAGDLPDVLLHEFSYYRR